MDERIVYTNQDGGVCIVIPSLTSGLTVEEIANKDVPFGTPFKILSSTLIPNDRTFRMGWAFANGHVEVDMSKAREIKREFLRKERQSELEKMDVEYIRALETNDHQRQAEITQRKNRLRAVTDHPAIEAAATPEELKALTLDGLVP